MAKVTIRCGDVVSCHGSFGVVARQALNKYTTEVEVWVGTKKGMEGDVWPLSEIRSNGSHVVCTSVAPLPKKTTLAWWSGFGGGLYDLY